MRTCVYKGEYVPLDLCDSQKIPARLLIKTTDGQLEPIQAQAVGCKPNERDDDHIGEAIAGCSGSSAAHI